LLVTLEHNPGLVFRVNPQAGNAIVETNITELLSQVLNTKVAYIIAGYNDMVLYEPAGRSRTPTVLMGIESRTPLLPGDWGRWNPDGRILIRGPNGGYSFQEVVDRTLKPKPMLVSVRAVINSPFAEDPRGTVYASGFDCDAHPAHNTAWIYRGTPYRQ
jgi:hypothetical protein